MTMTFQHFSTNDVPPSQRYEFWHEKSTQAFVELEIEIEQEPNFYGSFEKTEFASGAITRINSSSSIVHRSEKNIRHSDADCFLISLQLKGDTSLSQDYRSSTLKPGDLAIYDTTRAYDLKLINTNEQIVVEVPRKTCIRSIGIPDRLTAIKLDGNDSHTRICREFLLTLYRDLHNLDLAQQESMMYIFLELMRHAYQPVTREINLSKSPGQQLKFLMIKNHMLENLCDNDMNQESVSKIFGISRRYLNRLFEQEELSFSTWLRKERLERCCRDLENPIYNKHTVLEIAHKWGFNDASHFSRTFKNTYNCTALQYRKQSRL
jgi:AraC-like DNA-binding protein